MQKKIKKKAGVPDDSSPKLKRLADDTDYPGDGKADDTSDISDDALVTFDGSRIITYINKAAGSMLGYLPDELIGKPLDLLIPGNPWDVYPENNGAKASSDKPIRLMHARRPVLVVCKDGAERRAEASIFKSEIRGAEMYNVTLRDLSSIERAMEMVESSNSLLRAAIESTADGILVVDREGKVTSFNSKFLEMWGIPESLASTNDDGVLLGFVHNQLKDPGSFIDKVRMLYSRPEEESFDEIEFRDGKIFERYSRPQKIGETIVGRVWSFRDVTEYRRLVRSLNESLSRLSRKSRCDAIIDSINRSVSESSNINEILDVIVDTISRNIDAADIVSIFLVEGEVAVLKAYRGIPETIIAKVERIPYPKGLTWKTILGKKPILYCPEAETDTVIGPAGKEVGTHSYVSMPITGDAGCIGAVNINSLTANAFDEEELKMLEIVSKQIEGALQKARVLEALRQSEERYRILFHQSPVGVFIFNKDMIVTQCNQRLADILQSSREKIIGLDLKKLKDMSFFNAMKTATRGTPSYHEGVYEATTSSVRLWLSLHYSPLLDADGTVIGSMGVVEDITERKLAEQALRENERTFSTLLSNLPGYSYRCKNDPDWTLEFISDGVYELTGYSVDEYMVDRTINWGEKTHPADRDRVWEDVQKALEKDHPFELVYRIITKSDSVKWVWEKGRGVYSPEGELQFIEGFVTDITERKLLEEKYSQAQKMEAVGRLAGGIAHDYNNILTIIMSYCDMLLTQTVSADELRESVTEIRRAGERAAALTNQLLVFGRKQLIKPKVIDLNALLTGTKSMLRRLITVGITFDTVMEPELGKVKADPGQIELLLMNLVINAADSMPRGGTLTIRTANFITGDPGIENQFDGSAGNHVMLSVSDTGCGMSEETMSRIFEPFFTTKQAGKGTGLGLSIVYGIVKQSGGHITVESQLGTGSTFRIYLPVADGEMKPAESYHAPSEEFTEEGNETILVAEDEVELRTILCAKVRERGYTVLEAGSSDDVLHICETYSGRIHLMITDVIMPNMYGPELAARVKLLFPDIKIIYISGYTADSTVFKEILEERVPFLQKPFSTSDLLKMVRKVFS